MGEIWYVTRRYAPSKAEKVQVCRHNEKSVWIKGKGSDQERRESRTSTYHTYFPTFDEAKKYLVTKAQRRLESAKSNLERAQTELRDAEMLKETQ